MQGDLFTALVVMPEPEKDIRKGHYNGDVLVVKGKPVFQGKSRSISTNPYVIIEVLSESTLNYGLGAKRRKYEQMNTVREIVFVNSFDREVLVSGVLSR